MNDFVSIIRKFMVDQKIDYLLVNSTNKFLVEYNSLSENSRYHLTGFSGSTGDALVSMKDIFLFVDGRYHIQADLEVDKDLVTVVKLQSGQNFINEMLSIIPKDAILGLFSEKVSQMMLDSIQKYVKIKLLPKDPIDIFRDETNSKIESLSVELTGLSTEDKIAKLNLKDDEAVFLTNLEDVSYISNLRDFSKQFSSKIEAKAVLLKDKLLLFKNDDFDKMESYLKTLDKKIFIDKSSINAHDFALVADKCIDFNPVRKLKSIKTQSEINHYIDAFKKTDDTLLAVRDYIENNDNLSEFDIEQKLEAEFLKNGAKNLSFKPIIARNQNSALAHYSKSSPEEILSKGDLVLIDCGAYFDGGLATDITRVFVKGQPDKLQKEVYTKVLKAFLNSYNTFITTETCGFEIDNKARVLLNDIAPEGFIFNHGLGHGIGINVHEAPPNLSVNNVAKVPFENNMCFTIEPGLYSSEYFGVRLENSCYICDGKIKSFVHMPYERKLINFDMLSKEEKILLDEFGVI